MRSMHFSIWCGVFVLAMAPFALPVQAASRAWTGGNSNWDTPTNWSGNAEPGAADTATIGNGFGATINSGGNQVTTVTLGQGGAGALTVSGGAARLGVSNTFVIGNIAAGTLNIDSGGKIVFTGNTFFVARNAGSSGIITIDGAGSLLSITAVNPAIGNIGHGEMHLTNGGQFTQSGSLTTGNAITGSAALTIDGTGSQMSVGGILYLGSNGATSTIDITNGGAVISRGVRIGNGGTGTMTIDGAGSSFTSNGTNPYIGYTSTGTMNVQNGGTALFNDATLYVGNSAGGNGTLNVDGAGSLVAGSSSIAIGQGSVGALNVTNGADVDIGGSMTLGRYDGAVGTATIDGAGSSVSVSGMTIGSLGAGTFNLINGANLDAAGTLALAAGSTGVGTLNIGDGDAVGTVTATSVIGGNNGAGTINFNHNDAGYIFALAMSGTLAVNQIGTGTTILTGDSTYSGLTTIAGGVLQLGNGGATGGIQSDILNSTELIVDRSNTFRFDGIISGAGNFSQNGTGTTIFVGDQIYTGTTTINDGTLQLGDGGATGSVVGDIANGGTLAFNRSGVYSFGAQITGAGDVVEMGPGILIFANPQSYTGATTIDDGELHAGATNVIATSSGLTVNTGGIFAANGFDQAIATLTNNGIVNLFGGGASTNLNVTGNLNGFGIFGMDTDLGSGIGDHIDIAGTSSGAYGLAILNRGNPPASLATTLELVSTTDSSTGGATFRQLGDGVDVGVYSYTVQQGNGSASMPDTNNWYLALSPQSRSEVAKAIIGTAAVMSNSWFTQMDNLHRRMGKQRLVDPSAHENETWVRGYGREINVDASVTGRSFDERISGIDVGIDRVLSRNNGNTWIGGLFAGYGWADRDFNDYGSSGDTKTPYAGVYATWFNRNNYYVDLTAKLQYFDNSFNASDASGNIHHGSYDQWGYGTSAEFGKRFDVSDDGWILQPQVQLQYVRLTGGDYTTQLNSRIQLEADNVYQMRGGFELGKSISQKDGGLLYPYGRVSVIEQLSSGGDIKAETLSFSEDMDGASIEYGVGVIYQMDEVHQGYLAVTRSEGESYDQRWSINVGFRYEF